MTEQGVDRAPRQVILAPEHSFTLPFIERIRFLIGMPLHVRCVMKVEPDRKVDLVVESRLDVAIGCDLPALDHGEESHRG